MRQRPMRAAGLAGLLLFAAALNGSPTAQADPLVPAEVEEAIRDGRLVEQVAFQGTAHTHNMWMRGLGPSGGLIEEEGDFKFVAPEGDGDFCLERRTLRECDIRLSGDLVHLRDPITGEPLSGPACDQTTAENGRGRLVTADGTLYRITDLAWATSIGGALITADWVRPSDGLTGQIYAPVTTRRGQACTSEEGADRFNTGGTAYLVADQ